MKNCSLVQSLLKGNVKKVGKKRLANFEIEKIRENFFIPRSFDRKLLGILCWLEAR